MLNPIKHAAKASEGGLALKAEKNCVVSVIDCCWCSTKS